MKVLYQANFFLGEKNNKNIKDFKFLEDAEKSSIIKFVYKVENGIELCGTNKKSDNCFNYNQKNIIKRYNVFHYHVNFKSVCNNLNCLLKHKCLDITTEKNNYSSSEVIHYMLDVNKNIIIILAYSPIHDNGFFPKFYENPLLQRLKSNLNIEHQTFMDFLDYCTQNSLNATISSLSNYIKKQC